MWQADSARETGDSVAQEDSVAHWIPLTFCDKESQFMPPRLTVGGEGGPPPDTLGYTCNKVQRGGGPWKMNSCLPLGPTNWKFLLKRDGPDKQTQRQKHKAGQNVCTYAHQENWSIIFFFV